MLQQPDLWDHTYTNLAIPIAGAQVSSDSELESLQYAVLLLFESSLSLQAASVSEVVAAYPLCVLGSVWAVKAEELCVAV